MSEMTERWKCRLFQCGKSQWLILLLAGLLLLVVALPVSKEKEEEYGDKTGMGVQREQEFAEKTLIEEKLSELLTNVEGVGKVNVMVMTGENREDSFFADGYETVTGVLIAAQGADNYVTIRNIQEAVMALFQVDAHKIKVMKMK